MKRILALILAGLVLCTTGCAMMADSEGTELEFYYRTSDNINSGSAIQSEVKSLENVTVPEVMKRLFEGPEKETGFAPTFPEGTHLRLFSLKDGILALDISESFGTLSGYPLMLSEYCIVMTVSQLDGVEGVNITVEGKKIPGGAAGILTTNNVLLSGETQDPFTISSQLYFPTKEGKGLGVEYRTVAVESLEPIEQANGILSELVKGPRENAMIPSLASGMPQISSITDGMCVLAMDEESLASIFKEDDLFEVRLYSIVNSLTELEVIDTVKFELHGKEIKGMEGVFEAKYDF